MIFDTVLYYFGLKCLASSNIAMKLHISSIVYWQNIVLVTYLYV